ncbi:MAG: hypothetical protein KDA25_04525 [Phycisphaerales bacterium]|nr:hypothetical protein [Phycisphaerales bacterium]
MMSTVQMMLAQNNNAAGALTGGVFLVIWLAILVVVIVGLWKVFEKAGQPGWAAIIPIYNVIVLIQVAGKPIWWIILLIIPIVSIIPGILIPHGIAQNFGKGVGWTIGLIFLPFIFYPMLGFGSATYNPR